MNYNLGSFPNVRLRRNRKSAWMRELMAENHLSASDLIMPFFVISGKNQKEPTAIPAIYRLSIDLLIEEVKKVRDAGIPAIMLFPVIEQNLKSDNGKEAFNKKNLICQAIAAIKEQVKDIGVICDVALDPYTTHGHDGVLTKDGADVDNDQTVEILCKQALAQASAGCDIIAPSDMMDGRVGAIRQYLDQHGYQNVSIMSYAAKYASCLYSPFRDAVGSKSNLKAMNKKTYQMDFRNSGEAMREIALDALEGADMIIIKPGITYLDIVSKAKEKFDLPIISYQVSGEYSMLKLAAKNGIIDFQSALLENLIAFKRAGASAIISYGSLDLFELGLLG